MSNSMLIILRCVIGVFFLLYFYFTLELLERILKKSRLKKIWRIPLGITNLLLLGIFYYYFNNNITLIYLIFSILLLADFCLSYKDKFICQLFCVSACVIHITSIHSICVAIFSISTKRSIYETVNQFDTRLLSTLVTLIFLVSITICCIKLIPKKGLKIVFQYKTQLRFMAAWTTIFAAYLLFYTQIHEQGDHSLFIQNQIFAPTTILLGLYISLFFSMRTGTLLGYKVKNEELQQAFLEEQQYRKSIIGDVLMSYEFNLTKNQIIKGLEFLAEEGLEHNNEYKATLLKLAKAFVYHKDYERFLEYTEKIPFLYSQGNRETSIEYRYVISPKEYKWVRSVTTLVSERDSGNIKGFTYVKDIDEEKKNQMDLQFKAERDSLTRLYNKGMTEFLIADHLTAFPTDLCALFIIDVDNFKSINDHFGHTYGDAILCEFAERLKELFREKDIIGRIGGDEFIAFMKNVPGKKIIETKSKDILKIFYQTFHGAEDVIYTVSASIGIALSPEHGKDFATLYKNSDAALYTAKNAGKNTFRFFAGEDFMGYESNRTEIDRKGADTQKSFIDHRVEYIFKILYDSDCPVSAIQSVLKLIAHQFCFDHAYLIQNREAGRLVLEDLEWCSEGSTPKLKKWSCLPKTLSDFIQTSLLEKGIYRFESINARESIEKTFWQENEIQTVIQIGMIAQGNLLGVIGFDYCKNPLFLSNQQLEELIILCGIVSTFFQKQRSTLYSENSLKALTAVMNHLDSFTYVVEKGTFRVLFMNEKTKRLVGEQEESIICYETFREKEEPCLDCPVMKLTAEADARYTCEIYNEAHGIWTEATASYLNWVDGQTVYLLNCIDISKYKKKK